MKQYFLILLQYNDWANRRLFVALPDVVDAEPRALVLFSHLIMVERLWLARLQRSGETFQLWTPLPLSDLIHRVHENAAQWRAYLEGLMDADFEKLVSYVNSKGIAWENSVRDIVTHAINHSTHHRGQVVSLIRAHGLTPPAVDYIVFARKEA